MAVKYSLENSSNKKGYLESLPRAWKLKIETPLIVKGLKNIIFLVPKMEFVDNTINFMPPVASRHRRGLFSHLSRASSHEPISARDVDQNYFSLIYKNSYNQSLITEEYFSPKSFRHFESTFYFIYHPGMCFIIYF